MSAPRPVAPTGLPIEDAVGPLRAALAEGASAVLEAPPGAGKTTLVPLRLLDEPWLRGGRVLMLEPRRLAARAAATRMAALLGEEVGATVGYVTRFERRLSRATRVEVVTEGLLARRLQRDPALAGYGLVVFDEFHERSLDADLGLALCLDVQGGLRPDLRLLLMSATLDGEALARHLGGAARRVRAEGRLHPVRVEHLPPAVGAPLESGVAAAVERALAAAPGTVLVFLPGAAEIRRAEPAVAALGVEARPLHGELPRAAQDAALRPPAPGARKVVLATNVAETSLTIEGVTAVVDAGLERRPRFSPRSGMSRLVTVPISRASAEQRKGRAGRLGPGLCLRLWPEEEDRGRAERRPAEIEEADLAPLALQIAAWGVADAAALRFPTPPPAGPLAQARALLTDLGALGPGGAIAAHGRAVAELPAHPRLGHMLLRARGLGLLPTALAVAALLGGGRDPDRAGGDADLAARVERLARGEPGFAEARRVRDQLARALGAAPGRPEPEEAGAAVSLAYPDRLAAARPGAPPGGFRLVNGRGVRLDAGDPLARAAWLAVAEVEDGAEGRVRLAAAVDRATIERLHGERLAAREEVRFDPREGAVLARRVTRLGALTWEERPLDGADPVRVAAALCGGIRARGAGALPWTESARRFRERVAFLRRREPGRWPALDDAGLLAGLERWLAPHLLGTRRLAELRALDLAALLRGLLDGARRAELDRRAPAEVALPAGRRAPVDYAVEPPALAVELRDLFGQAATPAVDDGRVPLVLHLLSPARRPVAVTRDLAGFWGGGYAAVRKELRGRYPRHPWPEDPLAAAPTARPARRPRGGAG